MSEFSRKERFYTRGKHSKGRGQRLARPEFFEEDVSDGDVSTQRLSLRERRVHIPWGVILGLSALLAVFSVANPFLVRFADSLQSQALYAGKAMLAGQIPYLDFYGTSGLFYYLLTMVGSLFGSPMILMVLQFVLTAWAGMIFYKLIWSLTYHLKTSRDLLLAFYLGIACFGWGGLYASLFALPFVLNGLSFLLRYLNGQTRDEGFIFFGFNAATVFLIDPKSSLLWLVALVFLAIYHFKTRQKARGFYQFLASLLGFLIVVYAAGYYTILYQNIGAAIEQTFLYPLTTLGLSLGMHWEPLVIGAVLLLVTGMLTSLVYGFMIHSSGHSKQIKTFLYVKVWASLLLAIFESPFSVSNMVPLVPYGLLLTGLYMNGGRQALPVGEDEEEVSGKSFWVLNGFLPVLAIVYLFAYPAWLWVTESSIHQERTEVAAFVAQNTTKAQSIYAWDDSALVYLESERWASASYITPDTYLVDEEKWSDLNLALGYDKASHVVVNLDQPMLPSFEEHLSDSYEVLPLDLDHFKVYQLKD